MVTADAGVANGDTSQLAGGNISQASQNPDTTDTEGMRHLSPVMLAVHISTHCSHRH